MSKYQTYEKPNSQPSSVPTIIVRQNQMVFSASFVKEAKVSDAGFVQVLIDPKGYALAFTFSATRKTDKHYKLGQDKSTAKTFPCTKLLKEFAWIGVGKHKATWDAEEKVWAVKFTGVQKKRPEKKASKK